MTTSVAINRESCDRSLVSNCETGGPLEGKDFPHGVLVASTASVDKSRFIGTHDGSSATGNSTSVVYVSGSGSTRTYCVKEEPECLKHK